MPTGIPRNIGHVLHTGTALLRFYLSDYDLVMKIMKIALEQMRYQDCMGEKKHHSLITLSHVIGLFLRSLSDAREASRYHLNGPCIQIFLGFPL